MTVFSSMLVSFFLSNTFGCDIVTDRSYSTKDGVRIRIGGGMRISSLRLWPLVWMIPLRMTSLLRS